ncbi:IS3 family transposase [Alloscardovia theropitheci]|uniref:IS3 family transposase n=1 Tax=Alloscardovia theropitheci TaxID=2496842 RepID=A0A4R0QY52_9BIFI|nr:IS3 family transposase [Alloscardovia theropitheci]
MKTLAIQSLSERYPVSLLLQVAGLASSTYYYDKSHEKKMPRPELYDTIRAIYSRTANGMGHRQIAMCLRHEYEIRIANKTVLKIMKLLGLYCQIRSRNKNKKYSSYKGIVGNTAPNIINRDFHAERPWAKLGTDVTEFKHAWGKAYLAPVYDFASKEIIAWDISMSPNLDQPKRLLNQLIKRMPEGTYPVLHSDMGWQYQHQYWVTTLHEHGIRQSMSRKGMCTDNAATEQVFGHLKDEFFTGQSWDCFEDFATDLNNYIHYWNTKRRQVQLNGLTPSRIQNTGTHSLTQINNLPKKGDSLFSIKIIIIINPNQTVT